MMSCGTMCNSLHFSADLRLVVFRSLNRGSRPCGQISGRTPLDGTGLGWRLDQLGRESVAAGGRGDDRQSLMARGFRESIVKRDKRQGLTQLALQVEATRQLHRVTGAQSVAQ